MGIAGMGNSGTVLAALFAPVMAKLFGWNAVLGLTCIPLTIVFVIYMIFAKDSPNQPAPKPLRAYLHPLKDADAWWFMLFYGVTFGGFRSEEHTSELQSLMRISYAVFCLKKTKKKQTITIHT